ncbi:hypothetical protein PG993_014828 [Apiospora rasikravindrae]|uniref:Uncharacterized protein n=1 Tax=Apiospora rasikravindrae TaxID=990691 RepID=A0ABR1RQ39_9PEZI
MSSGKKSSKPALIFNDRSSQRESSTSTSSSYASSSSSNRNYNMPVYSSRTSSSNGSESYRSSKSKTKEDYKKEVSRPATGPVVVNHNARGYDRNEPSPSYSRSSGGTHR